LVLATMCSVFRLFAHHANLVPGTPAFPKISYHTNGLLFSFLAYQLY
jgi:hypothetical protein